MSDEALSRQRRALAIFDEVVDLDAEARTAHLKRLCGDDAGLRAQVEALLAADAEGQEPFSGDVARWGAALGAADEAPAVDPLLGRAMGAWRVVGILGHGGMGTVYAVERGDGAYAQQAALKLVRASADSEAVRDRFLRERQILAGLQHPNIATLLDGGFSEEGMPYFVMERVDGQPIDRWCDAQALDLRARVVLFLQVLEAVRHAHRNLVVHRDLKPSNLLVDAEGRVKLLDFGIAKQLREQGVTATHDRALTFEYASPEQLHDAPITTATDLWQLGVILHRLLSGAHPFGLTRDTPVARQLQQLERDPEPLTRAAAQAPQEQARLRGGLTPPALARALRGSLAAIVQTCLRHEPEQRYATAEALANDLRAWLDNRPVVAVPLSRGQRLRLWLRRNRLLAASLSTVSLALLAGSGVALWQAAEARAQADLARSESAAARAALGFLTDTLSTTAPEQTQSRDISVRQLLDSAQARLTTSPLPPRSKQALQRLLGQLYLLRGEPAIASTLLTQGLAGVVPEGRDEALAMADAWDAQSSALANLEQGKASMAAARKAADLRRRHAPGDVVQQMHIHDQLGVAHYRLGEAKQAIREWEQVLALSAKVPTPPVDVVSNAWQMLSGVHQFLGNSEEALRYAEAGLAFADRQNLPATDYRRINLLRGKGEALGGLGRLEASEQVLRDAVALQQRVVGGGHRLSLLLNAHATALNGLGRYVEAQQLLARVAEADMQGNTGPIDQAILLSNRASVHENAGDYPRAVSLLQKALQLLDAAGTSADAPERRMIARILARAMGLGGQPQAAFDRLQVLLARARALDGEDAPEVAMITWQLAVQARLLHDPVRGMPLLEESRKRWAALVPPTHPVFAHALRVEAALLRDQGALARADAAASDALQQLQAAGVLPVDVAIAEAELAELRMARGNVADARRLLQRALPVLRASLLPAQINRAAAEALALRLN